MNTDTSDSALLQAWQRHRDAEAFHAIVGRHGRLVYNTCRHILRNDTDAADVSQECFLSLASSPPSIRYSLAGWLHRLATHRSLDHLKAAKRRRDREVRYAREAVVPGEDEQTDLMTMVDEAIDALPDDLRLPLIEHFLRQKSHEEVADGLGIPRRTVTYRINSGVDRLREQLKRKGVAVPGAGLALALEAQDARAAEVPARIYEALGRHALAGARASALPSLGTGFAATVLMKKGWIAAGMIVGLALACWLAAGNNPIHNPKGTLTRAPLAEKVEHDDGNGGTTNVQSELAAPLESTPVAEPQSASVGQIRGRVFDADSNTSIPNTVVVIAPESGSAKTTCITNASGKYESPELPAGTYLIYRDKTPGYPSTKRMGVGKTVYDPVEIRGAHITLTKDATVDFPVRKGLVLAGRVLDKRERGIPGATVSAGGYGDYNAQTTESDSEGRFHLAGFSPTSDLHVRATKTGFGEVAMSKLSLIAPGNEDLTIHLPNAASVSGVVVDSTGTPLEGARIEAVHFQHYGAWTFDYPRGVSGKDGRFSVGELAPARYTLQVFPGGNGSYFDRDAAVVTLSEGEQRRDVRLVLNDGDGIEIAGRVTDPEDNPIAGASITLWGPVERGGQTDSEGHFFIDGLSEGEYQLTPYKKGYRPLGDDYFAFGPSIQASKYDYHLILEKFDLRVAGLVRDAESGAPLTGFDVAANTSIANPGIDPGIWFRATRFENVDGTFLIEVESSWRPEDADRPACAVYVRKAGYAPAMAIPTERADGTIPYVEIALERGRAIHGIVTDHLGAPVNGAIVAEGRVENDRPWGRNDLALTGNDGRFEVNGISESVEALTAIHPAYPNAAAELTDAAKELRIRFLPAGEIQGRVYLDGSPVPLARLRVEKDLETVNTSETRHGSADQHGAYRFGQLHPGGYRVITSQTEGVHFVFNCTVRAVVTAGETTIVDINLTGGTTLTGTLLIDGTPKGVEAVRYEVATERGTAEHLPRVNSDGTWRIDNVTPGAGVLSARGATDDGETLRRTIEIELAPGEERIVDIDLAEDVEPPREE